MAYLIGEVTKELLETVHEFCEKEVRDLCRNGPDCRIREKLRLFEMDDPDGDQDAVRPWLHDNRKMRSERNFFRKDQL